MKRNPEFLLRRVAGTIVVVPVGKATADFPGMITLNETGAYLWEQLEQDQTVESLTAALTQAYEVDEQLARRDVTAFVERLQPTGAILDIQ